MSEAVFCAHMRKTASLIFRTPFQHNVCQEECKKMGEAAFCAHMRKTASLIFRTPFSGPSFCPEP